VDPPACKKVSGGSEPTRGISGEAIEGTSRTKQKKPIHSTVRRGGEQDQRGGGEDVALDKNRGGEELR